MLTVLGCVAASAAVAVAGAAAVPAPKIHWTDCAGSERAQCGTIHVPLDWSEPHGDQITLAVARRPADRPGARIGTLFYNPGGPGDGGVKYVVGADGFFSGVFSAEVKARFDIVAMDPRGVGESTPIRCGVPVVVKGVTLFPRNRAQFDALKRHSRAVGRSCLRDSGELARHVDTASVARDHEALRKALGVRQVSWLAISYGAQIAANFAALFPDRNRVVVIDSALDHSGSETAMSAEGIAISEDAFNRFTTWCRTDRSCALRGRNVPRLYDLLVRRATAHPIRVDGAVRPVSGEDIVMATAPMLTLKEPSIYGPDASWAGFSRALAAALAGNAVAFAIPVGYDDPARGANACLDYNLDVHTWPQMQRRLDFARQLAPHLHGGSEIWQILNCIGWPIPPANPLHRLDVRGIPTMIVNATHDPETSYRWAHELAAQIRGSVMVTRIGDGHTSYYTSSCARTRIDAFLVSRHAPVSQVCRR
jgi:pimeloyl-ACP methyl ester carboxylesterase